jgi:hypothetical protein
MVKVVYTEVKPPADPLNVVKALLDNLKVANRSAWLGHIKNNRPTGRYIFLWIDGNVSVSHGSGRHIEPASVLVPCDQFVKALGIEEAI